MVLFTSVSISYFSLILLSQSNQHRSPPQMSTPSASLWEKTDPEPLKISSGPET